MSTIESPMLRVALVGYGRMGREIERLAASRGATIAATYDVDHPLPAGPGAGYDVAIEFTHPTSAVENVMRLVRNGVPIVVGTTGWLDHLDTVREAVDRYGGRVVYGSNYSVGVQLFLAVTRATAQLIDRHDMYDVAVHEVHHAQKADAPSGTALTVARVLLDEISRKSTLLTDTSHARIDPSALHVTSQRLGAVIGTHRVSFDSEADCIEIVHCAKNRSGFALGALLAARWIVQQPPGLYRFEDLFNAASAT